MAGFLRLACIFWVKRKVLENNSSKHEQLAVAYVILLYRHDALTAMY